MFSQPGGVGAKGPSEASHGGSGGTGPQGEKELRRPEPSQPLGRSGRKKEIRGSERTKRGGASPQRAARVSTLVGEGNPASSKQLQSTRLGEPQGCLRGRTSQEKSVYPSLQRARRITW
jgi:hypothetical protein